MWRPPVAVGCKFTEGCIMSSDGNIPLRGEEVRTWVRALNKRWKTVQRENKEKWLIRWMDRKKKGDIERSEPRSKK